MSEERISVGDVVVLKSGGGPRMTVAYEYKDGSVGCQWFEGTELKSGMFPRATLRKAGDDEVMHGEKLPSSKLKNY